MQVYESSKLWVSQQRVDRIGVKYPLVTVVTRRCGLEKRMQHEFVEHGKTWWKQVLKSLCFFKFQPFHLFHPKSFCFIVKCSRNTWFGGEKFLGQIYILTCWHHVDTFQNCLLAKLHKLKAVSLYARSKRAGISLGVIRLDYHYPPAPGDVAHPGRNQMKEWLMHTLVHWR